MEVSARLEIGLYAHKTPKSLSTVEGYRTGECQVLGMRREVTLSGFRDEHNPCQELERLPLSMTSWSSSTEYIP